MISSFGNIGEAIGTENDLKPEITRNGGPFEQKSENRFAEVKSEKAIVFATIFLETMSFFSEMFSIYTEAFKRLGYNFKLVSLPGERAIVDANSGAVDGEAARISYISLDKYPNLIRVQEPIVIMKEGAYSVDTSIKIDGWESLRGTGYNVGFLRGIKSVEQKLPQYVEEKNIVILTDFEQSLKMLQARRIDVFIVSTQMEESTLMKSGEYSDIKRVGIIEEKSLYPYFHKRHKDLVPRLAETLKAMKNEGTFQKLREQTQMK
jgi:ABC-type amino acid transport substrate-binding protein